MNQLNICIAGLGTVGSNVIATIENNIKTINYKTSLSFNILGISAKNKTKKRIFNIDRYQWFENPLDLVDVKNCQVLIELIGEEKGLSYDLVKGALNNKINVITANSLMINTPIIVVNRSGNEKDKNSMINFWGSSFVTNADGDIIFMNKNKKSTNHIAINLIQKKVSKKLWAFCLK